MKYALSKRVVLGLMTAMIVASPVFAETTPSMSRPLIPKAVLKARKVRLRI